MGWTAGRSDPMRRPGSAASGGRRAAPGRAGPRQRAPGAALSGRGPSDSLLSVRHLTGGHLKGILVVIMISRRL